jgi:hypothetical protein
MELNLGSYGLAATGAARRRKSWDFRNTNEVKQFGWRHFASTASATSTERWRWFMRRTANLIGLLSFAGYGAIVVLSLVESCKTHADSPITLQVSPKVALATPGNRVLITAKWRVERHPDNRFRSLAWGSPFGEIGSDLRQMDGEQEAVAYQNQVEIPQGDYLFEACVYRTTEGKNLRFCDQKPVVVQ